MDAAARRYSDPGIEFGPLQMSHSNRPGSVRLQLALSAEKCIAYYQGSAQVVVARSEDNRIVRFPASAIRQFVTRDGVFGRFEITFDDNNKLVAIRQID